LHEFRQVFLLGLIVGIVIELFGIAVLYSYNSLGGIICIVIGLMFLAKSIPVFIPTKQKNSISVICPYCGAINSKDSKVCEKCKLQLDG
jgi:hypothetical protein